MKIGVAEDALEPESQVRAVRASMMNEAVLASPAS